MSNNMLYVHADKPMVTLSLVTENGKSNVECMVIQNERYFKNPKNKNNYFNHLGKTSSTVRISTALGNAYVKSTPLLRLNQEQYSINYTQLRKVKGTPTEDCSTSKITMYLIRKNRTYWFASSCFADAFYTIKSNQLVLTKYTERNGKIDQQVLVTQQKGVPLPKNGFEAQKKAISLYADLMKAAANIKSPLKKIAPLRLRG